MRTKQIHRDAVDIMNGALNYRYRTHARPQLTDAAAKVQAVRARLERCRANGDDTYADALLDIAVIVGVDREGL